MSAPVRFAGSEALLHETASAMTGFKDFGGEDYHEGLSVLLGALDGAPALTPLGRELAFGMLLGTLAARLFSEQGWKERPDSRQQAIHRPLVIVGVPRTGTTALHKLLSLDPQFQGLDHWLSDTPMPRPPRETWPQHPCYQQSAANLRMLFEQVPELRVAHEIAVDEVDECLEVLKQGFVSNRFGSTFDVPDYDQWCWRQSEQPSYRRYADVLRLMGANAPGKPWLLKNPGHLAQLDCLLQVFPDACVVQTHRDPVQAIPSLCSLLQALHRVFYGDAARPQAQGPRELRYWAAAAERSMALRAAAARPGQFYDVDHRRFHSDPIGVVRGIYHHFGFQLAAATERVMRRWLAENPAAKHGEHRYTAEQFGLTAGAIRERFSPYMRHYGLDS